MSISIGPMGIGNSLPQAQPQVTQAATTHSPKATVSNPPSASGPGRMPATPAGTAKAEGGEAVKLSAQQTELSIQEINKVLAALSIGVQFQIDPHYKEPIIRVVEQATGKLIRQIPSEEVVRMSKIVDTLKGLLFSQAV